jgi:hypothetical protein
MSADRIDQQTATEPAEIARTVEATLDRIERSWHGLLDALDGIPVDRLAEPGAVGDWSVKEVIGHIAFWDEQAVVAAHREMAGEPALQVDWQAMNEREAAANRSRTAVEQRAKLDRAHAEVVALLRAAPRLDPRSIGLCGCLQEDTYEHYDEHAADIRAWRQRVGV